jgi:hypothetical protein
MQGVIDSIIENMNQIPLVPPFPKWENTPSFKRKEKLIIRKGTFLNNKGKGKT